jgi:predicted nucleotidyltransferase
MAVDLAPALAVLRREAPGIAAVYLFGSSAVGAERPDSDIDLAIYAGKALDRSKLFDLREALAQSLGRDVDLVDLATAPTILQMQVIGEGRLVEARDADAAGFFEVRVMRDYQDLKERRAGIEADIVQRGRVYA